MLTRLSSDNMKNMIAFVNKIECLTSYWIIYFFFFCCFYRYHEGTLYVIDVSQSVEHDHPHALEFLRKDCTNVNGGHIFILDDYIIK